MNMNRSLYSLVLSDPVVEEIDRLAAARQTNRSALVDRILAQYLSMMTPEQQIANVFHHIESLFSGLPFFSSEPAAKCTMRLKTSLDCKYQPALRYEVRLFPEPEGHCIGRLTVQFRSRSQPLLEAADRFFCGLIRLEERYIAPLYPAGSLRYELGEGRFVRSMPLRKGAEPTEAGLGSAITAYIQMVDTLFKQSLTGYLTDDQFEQAYVACLDRAGDLLNM